MTGWQRIVVARAVATALMIGWGLAYAATNVLLREAPDMIGAPWAQIAVGALIASWGGAAATLGRYLAASYANRPFRWLAEAIRDAVVSVCVGAGGYLAGWWYGLDVARLGVLLLLCGFAGVGVLTIGVARLLGVLLRKE